MELIAAVFILAQAAYWLFWRERTDELDAKIWNACLYPGVEK